MALTGVRGDVDQAKVAGLLQARRPDILDAADPAQVERFEARVRGASVTVVLLAGPDPAEGPLRDLAAEAIAAQTASEIEYAEYPEQQTQGDVGRGYHLHQIYLELLAQLRVYIETGTTSGVVGVTAPVGSFPAPARDIDPNPWEAWPWI